MTAVLSNADSTLVERMKHEQGIFDLFDDVLCSADVGLAKPDRRVYELAARRLGLGTGECLFVDDLAENVEAARDAGMQAVLHLVYEGHSLEAQLAEFGVRAGTT
jgi:HAD superfamily hydrolase (TIGR01509 family)